MSKNMLPNGEIVKIKGLENHFLIVSKVPLVNEKDTPVYYDYQGALLPQDIANE